MHEAYCSISANGSCTCGVFTRIGARFLNHHCDYLKIEKPVVKIQEKPMIVKCEKHGCEYSQSICVQCLEETGNAICMREIKPASDWVEFNDIEGEDDILSVRVIKKSNIEEIVDLTGEGINERVIFYFRDKKLINIHVQETLAEVMEKIK